MDDFCTPDPAVWSLHLHKGDNRHGRNNPFLTNPRRLPSLQQERQLFRETIGSIEDSKIRRDFVLRLMVFWLLFKQLSQKI